MSSLPTPPRLGPRLPLPPPPRDAAHEEGAEDDTRLRLGDLLEGRYQIEDRIGEGGVGFVYRALQLKLHRRVAVKLLQQDVVHDEPLRPRFQQEALTLAALSHPNIVTLQDYGLVRGRPFLVMELLEGRTLRAILDEEGALSPARALTFARQLLLALAYAHDLGIVHRDLKPANLFVQALPSYEHVKVLDFGMVKLLPGSYLDRGEQLTRQGFTNGTPAYMSPEHALGREVDGRSDLYTVGVLLFEMLSGDKPFHGEPHDVLRHHLTTPVPPLSAQRPELAAYPELQALIERAMAKEPEDRFASATELLHEVDRLLLSGLMAEGEPELGEPLGAASYEAARAHALEARPLGPRMRETIEDVASRLSGYGRTGREVWRSRASPQLVRARRELQALAARLAPLMRGLSDAAWARLRPRIARAADRIGQAALETKARLERSPQEPGLLLPSPAAAEIDPDATVVGLPPFETGLEGEPTRVIGRASADDASDQRAPSPSADSPSGRLRSAGDTAEPLMLEPREPTRPSHA